MKTIFYDLKNCRTSVTKFTSQNTIDNLVDQIRFLTL